MLQLLLLDYVAVLRRYMPPTVNDRVAWSVGLSVGLSPTVVSPYHKRDLYQIVCTCCLGPPPAGWRNPRGGAILWGKRSGPLQRHWTLYGELEKKEKGKEEYLYSAIYTTHSLKALRHGSHSFSCKLHHACLSYVSVHQTAPPLSEVADIQLQLTTHLSTPTKWKAELAWSVDC